MFETEGATKMLHKLTADNGTTYAVEYEKWFATLKIPAARFGNPEDIGAMCALLCSRFASYIVGQSIVMDGGQIRTVF